MKEIELFDFTGDFAENKDVARKLRFDEISPELKKGKSIIINFKKVESATQSFIHALISGVIREYTPEILEKKLLFKNCNSKIKPIIEIVVEYVQDGIYTDDEADLK